MPRLKLSTYLARYPGLRNTRARLSKRVTERVKAADGLCSSINVMKDEVGAAFQARLEEALGEAVPDPRGSLEAVGRWVRAASDRLERQDSAYTSKGLDRAVLRRQSRQQASELYPRIRDLRRLLDSTFGKEQGLILHGIRGKTLRKPQRLYDQATPVVECLRDPGFEPPPPRVPGTPVDRAGWLESVAAPYDRLGAMLARLGELELEERDELDARDAELATFDRIYREAYDYVQSVYVIAGKDPRLLHLARPLTERRRLANKARQEAQARADGRRPRLPATLRSAVSTVSDSLSRGGGPKNVA